MPAQRGLQGAVMKYILIAALSAAALYAPAVGAHSGGLNSEGCHNNRKTGDYHCHRAPSASRAPSYGSSLAPSNSRGRGSDGAYANCAAARAAGAAPVRRGEPGYGAHLDRDNDGIGCE
jgi:hypothetical protein